MNVQNFYDYCDMLKQNNLSAQTLGGKLVFADDAQYQEFLEAGIIIGALLLNSSQETVYNKTTNTIWHAVEAKVTEWGKDPVTDMNARHYALIEVLSTLSEPSNILDEIAALRIVAKFDVKDDETLEFGGSVYVKADPYSSMAVDDFRSSNKVYRIFMHPQGNDLNDGLTWDTPIKSLVRLGEILPKDLSGYKVYVLFHPGIYDLDVKAELNFYNGEIYFQWVGSYFNTLDNAYGEFVRAGKTAPISSDDQVILTTTTMNDILFIMSGNNNLTFWFGANDWSKNVADAGHGFHNKFVFKGNTAMNALFILENLTYYHYVGATLDLQGANNGVVFWGEIKGNDSPMKIIGGTGGSSVGSSVWQGVYYVESRIHTVNYSCFNVGYATGYEPTKQVEISNITRFINVMPLAHAAGLAVDLPTAKIQITGSAPKIYLGEKSDKFIVTYDTANFVLETVSVNTGVIKKYTSGVLQSTISYLNNKLKTSGNSFIYKVSTTVPADEDMSNQDVVFYMDETTDTLKVKYKDSTGTVQTGDIAVLS